MKSILAAVTVMLIAAAVALGDRRGLLLERNTAAAAGGGGTVAVDSQFRGDAWIYPDPIPGAPAILTNTVGSGNGRLLVATFSLSSAGSGDSVTQALAVVGTTTNAMTKAGYVRPNGSATSGEISLWYLINPTAGNNIIYALPNVNPDDALIGNCTSFSNSLNSSFVVSTNQGVGTSATGTASLSSGDMSVAVCGTGTAVGTVSATTQWKTNYSTATGAGAAACNTTNGAGTKTHTFTVTSDSWGVVVLAIPHN